MPKPLFGDNGSGMHVHQSIFNGDAPLFYEKGAYANLSEMAMHYIGGILHHAPALIALTNPVTNSFKRLVPGYEAPVNLVFSKGNRSAAVRIPVAAVTPKGCRIEFRTPDSTANPYLAFAAMLMAGLDGIKSKIDPRALGYGPFDKNIYELSEEEKKEIRSVPGTFDEAFDALEADYEFLTEGGVFTKDFIDNYVDIETWRSESSSNPYSSTRVQPVLRLLIRSLRFSFEQASLRGGLFLCMTKSECFLCMKTIMFDFCT